MNYIFFIISNYILIVVIDKRLAKGNVVGPRGHSDIP